MESTLWSDQDLDLREFFNLNFSSNVPIQPLVKETLASGKNVLQYLVQSINDLIKSEFAHSVWDYTQEMSTFMYSQIQELLIKEE